MHGEFCVKCGEKRRNNSLTSVVNRIGFWLSITLTVSFVVFAMDSRLEPSFADLLPEDAEWCQAHTTCTSSTCCLDYFGY